MPYSSHPLCLNANVSQYRAKFTMFSTVKQLLRSSIFHTHFPNIKDNHQSELPPWLRIRSRLLSIYPSIHLPAYLSNLFLTLQSFCWTLILHTVGRTPLTGGISLSQGYYLHIRQHNQRKKQTDIHASSWIWTHDPGVWAKTVYALDRVVTVIGNLRTRHDNQ
jgi:hypothetical protein